MATQTPPRPQVTQPSLGPIGWARWAWRSLTSMRTALFLLLLLGLCFAPLFLRSALKVLLLLLLRLAFLQLLLALPFLLLFLQLGLSFHFSLLGLTPFQFLEPLLGRLSFLRFLSPFRRLLLCLGFSLLLFLLGLTAFGLALFLLLGLTLL